MADHWNIGDPPDHGVTVDALSPTTRAVATTIIEQVTEHYRGITVDSGVGDRHTEFNGAHDRVGDNSSNRRRRLRHRAPRHGRRQGVGTCIICRPGPISAHRHDPNQSAVAVITCTPFPEEPLWALRLQIAYLYFDSAIAKMGVADWQNGSAFYYFVRDKMFGSAGPLSPIWMWISEQSLTTLAITWGTIVIELAIALFTLLDALWRMAAFRLCLTLHALILLSMGLFSFSLVMAAIAALIATPNTPVSNRLHQPLLRKHWAEHNNSLSPEVG
jgi:hypothetical protein